MAAHRGNKTRARSETSFKQAGAELDPYGSAAFGRDGRLHGFNAHFKFHVARVPIQTFEFTVSIVAVVPLHGKPEDKRDQLC